MIDISNVRAVAATANGGVTASFGIYLPNIDPASYRLIVRVIHDNDRFDPSVQPVDMDMDLVDPASGLWSVTGVIGRRPATSFGLPGRYLYRYQLQDKAGTPMVRWFTDPFAQATDDVGQLSAVDTAPPDANFEWTDDRWKVPELDDLIVYELHVEEFNDGFAGVSRRLEYLQSLGVNCLELMPVSSLKLDFAGPRAGARDGASSPRVAPSGGFGRRVSPTDQPAEGATASESWRRGWTERLTTTCTPTKQARTHTPR